MRLALSGNQTDAPRIPIPRHTHARTHAQILTLREYTSSGGSRNIGHSFEVLYIARITISKPSAACTRRAHKTLARTETRELESNGMSGFSYHLAPFSRCPRKRTAPTGTPPGPQALTIDDRDENWSYTRSCCAALYCRGKLQDANATVVEILSSRSCSEENTSTTTVYGVGRGAAHRVRKNATR